MAKYLEKVKSLILGLKSFEIQRVPRQENTKADALSHLATSDLADINSVLVETLSRPSIDELDHAMHIEQESSWMDPLLSYLKDSILPEDRKEARRLTLKAARYTLVDGQLYKRSFTLPYLKCLPPSRADYVLREIHEGICGSHLGGRTLAHKTLRQGYYWPTMMKDAKSLVQKCERCQKFAPVPHRPTVPLTPISSPLPFAMWGMDILGPFPVATGQRKFIVVSIDYFTKWVEAEPLAIISEQNIRNFFWKSVICRFGIPRILITDNGKQFDNKRFRAFMEELNIDHRFTSVGHPQANGLAEVTNRTLLEGIKKRLYQAKGLWAEELPSVLWSYRTTRRTATGESPFTLSFGSEAVVPVEIGLPTYRIERFEEEANEEGLRANLDLLEEAREAALIRVAAYQQRICKYHNSRVRARPLLPGSLVLRKAEVSDPTNSGKLSPNWEGPYRVAGVTRPGSYRLEAMDGTPIPRSWNGENLKQYYQ